jgi:hypothetical protein
MLSDYSGCSAGSAFYFFICLLLFCLPHKKVAKKVTATVKFAKIVALRAKKLNIAIQSQSHEQVQTFFISFSRFKSSSGNCQFFLTPSTSRFFNAISRMRFRLVESSSLSIKSMNTFFFLQMQHNGNL